MRWLPRLYVESGATICDYDGENEGLLFGFRWLGVVVELVVARRIRTVG